MANRLRLHRRLPAQLAEEPAACSLKQSLARPRNSFSAQLAADPTEINFEGTVLGCINETIPSCIAYHAQIDEICLFVHAKL